MLGVPMPSPVSSSLSFFTMSGLRVRVKQRKDNVAAVVSAPAILTVSRISLCQAPAKIHAHMTHGLRNELAVRQLIALQKTLYQRQRLFLAVVYFHPSACVAHDVGNELASASALSERYHQVAYTPYIRSHPPHRSAATVELAAMSGVSTTKQVENYAAWFDR